MVYVIMRIDQDSTGDVKNLCCVCSSKEKAEDWVRNHPIFLGYYDIYEETII